MRTWPAPLRHLILLTAALLLSWAATDVVPALQGQTGWGALLAGALAALLAVLTPLVQSYGVGSAERQRAT